MKKLLSFGLAAACLALPLLAEQNPPQPQMPLHAGEERHRDARGGGFGMHAGGDETERILPPGPWWKDQDLVKRIELTPDQQKRIEDTFLQNKIELIHMHASLEEEELLLEPLLNANPVDQAKTLAQISKIADTRASLEKANAKMLLQVRAVLNQQQWSRLQQERAGMRQHMMQRTQNGPRSFNHLGPDGERMRLQMRGPGGQGGPGTGPQPDGAPMPPAPPAQQ